MVLAVPPGHRLAGRESIPVGEIDGEDFVGFTEELSIRKEIDRWLRRTKVSVKVVHEFDNIENIKRAIEVGSGIAILPLPTVRRESEIGSLSAVPFSDVNWLRPLGIVHKRSKTLGSAAQKFIEMLLHQDPKTFQQSGIAARTAPVSGEKAAALNGRNGHGVDVGEIPRERKTKRKRLTKLE